MAWKWGLLQSTLFQFHSVRTQGNWPTPRHPSRRVEAAATRVEAGSPGPEASYYVTLRKARVNQLQVQLQSWDPHRIGWHPGDLWTQHPNSGRHPVRSPQQRASERMVPTHNLKSSRNLSRWLWASVSGVQPLEKVKQQPWEPEDFTLSFTLYESASVSHSCRVPGE